MCIIPCTEGAPALPGRTFSLLDDGKVPGVLMEGLGKLGWCEDTWGLGREAVYQWARTYFSISAIPVSYLCTGVHEPCMWLFIYLSVFLM